jgi:putative ABC transport system permease protein
MVRPPFDVPIMRFTTIAWRNLLRRPTRTLLTVAGLGIAVAAVVALVGISDGFERSYVDLFHDRQVELIVQRASNSSNLNRQIEPSLREKIQAIPGVKEVFPGLMDVISLDEYGLTAVFVVGWEPGSRLMNRLEIIDGESLARGDEKKAIIGKTLAANTGLKAGGKLKLYGEEVTVKGVYDGHNVFENGGLFVPLDELQRMMDTKLVTAFSISLAHPDDPAEMAAVERRVAEIDSSLLAQPAADFVNNIQQIKLARGVAWAVSAIAVMIGAIGMLNTMVMSVAERVREIGTLRAIGWPKHRVMSIIFFESILLSAGGAVLGTIAAIGLTKFLSGFHITSGLIQGRIAPIVMVQGVLVAVLVGVSGAAYPAFWGASQPPTEAMRRK